MAAGSAHSLSVQATRPQTSRSQAHPLARTDANLQSDDRYLSAHEMSAESYSLRVGCSGLQKHHQCGMMMHNTMLAMSLKCHSQQSRNTPQTTVSQQLFPHSLPG